MTLIGITGYARNGKDEVAKVLHDEYGFVVLRFSAPLKDLALRVDPWVDFDVGMGAVWYGKVARLSAVVEQSGWEVAKMYPETRRFLQELGTGIRDTIDEDFWIKCLSFKANRLMYEEGESIAIPDVRFPNEADWVRSRGGKIWRVERETLFDSGVSKDHPSERGVDFIIADTFIPNFGTLEDLKRRVSWLMRPVE